jgi:hypothetical protein
MQATCNNLCARLAAIAFVLGERCIGIAEFLGQSLFDNDAGKVILTLL